MSKLYEITADMRELQALVDTEELSADMVADTLDALNIEFKDKALACLKVRQHLLSEVAGIDTEIERLQALKEAPQNNAIRIADYVKGSMLSLDKDKLDLGLFKLTLRKPTKKLGAIDEDKVPAEYWVTVPETKKLDKRSLLARAKEAAALDVDLDFVELADSERSLTIK